MTLEDMQENPQESSSVNGGKMLVSFIWLASLVIAGYGGYMVGQTNQKPLETDSKKVLQSMTTATPALPTVAEVSPTLAGTPACAKSGYAQKWEFLTSYVVKQGDTPATIAEDTMGDSTRANEVMQINGIPLVVGSTIYLPPSIVTKSNGYLKQVHGKIIEKNASMWHLSFTEDEKGLGILIPTYWFAKVPGKDNYQVGDCVTVLLDDGNTVFSIAGQ